MPNNRPFTTTVLRTPASGRTTELKRAIEGYWAGRVSAADLAETAAGLRRDTWTRLADAGFDSIPVNTFSYYDQVLDTAVMLDALPPGRRHRRPAGPLLRRRPRQRRCHAAGDDQVVRHELPLLGPGDRSRHHLRAQAGEGPRRGRAGARARNPARPVIVGPITFLTLAKAVDGAPAPITRIDDILPPAFEATRPSLSTPVWTGCSSMSPRWSPTPSTVRPSWPRPYGRLSAVTCRPALLVATYFRRSGCRARRMARTDVEGTPSTS